MRLILVLSLVFLGACKPSGRQQASDISKLPDCFGLLESLQATDFRNVDWCKAIAYKRGQFSDNLESSACNLFKGGSALPFDAQSRQDFEAVFKAIRLTGVKVNFITGVEYGKDGKLKKAEFHLSSAGRHSYVYSPGYDSLPQDVPSERIHTALNKDWYYVWEDWN